MSKLPFFLLVFLVSFSSVFSTIAQRSRYTYLWDEMPHFTYYRILVLEGNLYDIRTLLKKIDTVDKKNNAKLVRECLFHLDMIERVLGNEIFFMISDPEIK